MIWPNDGPPCGVGSEIHDRLRHLMACFKAQPVAAATARVTTLAREELSREARRCAAARGTGSEIAGGARVAGPLAQFKE